MMKDIKTPMEQAEIELPHAWYEMNHGVFIAATIISAIALGYLYNYLPGKLHTPIINTAVCMAYIAGTITDRVSTYKYIKAVHKAEFKNIKPIYIEKNLLARNLTDPDKFIRDPTLLFVDFATLAISIINPGIGLAFTGNRLIATLNNNRVAKRTELANQISER